MPENHENETVDTASNDHLLLDLERILAYAETWKLEWPLLISAGTVVVIAAGHLLWNVGPFLTATAVGSGAALSIGANRRYSRIAKKAAGILEQHRPPSGERSISERRQ